MDKHFIRILTLLMVGLISYPSGAQRKAVFIILDGISADALEKTKTPFIDEISATGGYTRAYTGGVKETYNESPTISAPGYNHILTGTWSNKHNVWDNDIREPNYNYHNIFRIAEDHDPNLKTAIFSTWLDNRTKLIGDGLPQAGNIKSIMPSMALSSMKKSFHTMPTSGISSTLMNMFQKKQHGTCWTMAPIFPGFISNTPMIWGTGMVIVRNIWKPFSWPMRRWAESGAQRSSACSNPEKSG
jgi:hypothetical protein